MPAIGPFGKKQSYLLTHIFSSVAGPFNGMLFPFMISGRSLATDGIKANLLHMEHAPI